LYHDEEKKLIVDMKVQFNESFDIHKEKNITRVCGYEPCSR